MTCKYIIFQTPEGQRAVLFPDSFYHDQIAATVDDCDVVSAGFTGFDENREVVCYGESTSLKIGSKGIDDQVVINHQLKFRDG